MASKRMFSIRVIDSDDFMDMSATAQLLYFHLALRADDDGFVGNPKTIMRMIGGNIADMQQLIQREYIIAFSDSVVVIRHWRIHNVLRKDTYHETIYTLEKSRLSVDENGAYVMNDDGQCATRNEFVTSSYRDRTGIETQLSQDKTRQVKSSQDEVSQEQAKETKPKRKRFVPPSLDEVQSYITEKGFNVDAERFISYYESNGWMVGRNHMKDWKATVRNWNAREKSGGGYQGKPHKTARQQSYEDTFNFYMSQITGGDNEPERDSGDNSENVWGMAR